MQEPRNTLTTQPLVRIMQSLDSVSEKFRTKLRNNMGGLVFFLLLYVIATVCRNCVGTFFCLTYYIQNVHSDNSDLQCFDAVILVTGRAFGL